MPLTDEDMAYMRETQADHRPTSADLRRKVPGSRTPTGGVVATWAAPEPVMIRIDGAPDEVPQVIADRLEGGTAVSIAMDMVPDVRWGDTLTVSITEVYEVVSDGDPDAWATAQVVIARRIVRPNRT